MPTNGSAQPKTLADDLRSRTDEEVAAVLRARPDLLHPIPSDMRALTTRAATSPSIARYLDTVDAVHHYALRIAAEQTASEPTSIDSIVDGVVGGVGDESVRDYARECVTNLRSAAVLWGSESRMHVVTAVRDQVAAVPVPPWPAPMCDGIDIDHVNIDQRSVSAAHALIGSVEEIVDLWSVEPAPVLRSGGLSARGLDALSERCAAPRDSVAIAIDLAWAAGLIAQGPTDRDIAWMPTATFDTWCEQPAARRWATLARAWLIRSGVTGARPLLDSDHPFTTSWREHLLTVATEATATCSDQGAADIIDFRWPRRRGTKRNEALAALRREAEVLGVMVDGVISHPGKVLASGASIAEVAKAIAPHLPKDVHTVHVQADHTIVAPGPLEPPLGRRLRTLADVESRGHATVFRVTNDSLRRGLAIDPDPDSWVAFLTEINDKALPQPIAYAITDAARSKPRPRHRFQAPDAPSPLRRHRVDATPARVEKALDVLRDRQAREGLAADVDAVEVPKMESAAVVAGLRYAIDHHETVHLSHAESDGSTAVLMVDPIRLGGGSLTAYDHRAEQVRTLAVSRITGVASVRISA